MKLIQLFPYSQQEIQQLKQQLKQRDTDNTEAIAKMQEQLTKIQDHIPLLHKIIAQGHQGIKSSEMGWD